MSPDGSWTKTTRTDVMWTVLPAGLRWTAPASKDDRGSWKDLALSAQAQPLVGLDVTAQDGYGIINVRGRFEAGGAQATPWTSDDSGGSTMSRSSRDADDAITMLRLRNAGNYGVVDVSFTTRKGFESGWFTNNKNYNKEFRIDVTGDNLVVGLVGRKWPRHGLMDLQLALHAKALVGA